MTNVSSPRHDRSADSVDFPVRLFTALRTMRLYPPTNPQVVRNIASAFQAYKALFDPATGEDVTLGVSERKILVNGQQLSEKDQTRPQVAGIIDFLEKLKLHSLAFRSTFTEDECARFIEILAPLLGKKAIEEQVPELLQNADLPSVGVDTKRFVVVHEGEKVVREDQVGFGSGVNISDDEMASFIMGQTGVATTLGSSIPRHLEPLLSMFGEALQEHENPAKLTTALFNALHDQSTEDARHQKDIAASADTIAHLDPEKLTKLLTLLPYSNSGDALLNATIDNLQPRQLNELVNTLIIDLAQQAGGSDSSPAGDSKHAVIKRLINTGKGGEIQRTIAMNVDARQLVDNPNTTIGELPPHLVQRLQQPEWSAPVLANAVQQATDDQPPQGAINTEAVNRMLSHYEQLLDKPQQQQVAARAGQQLASMEAVALGNVLAQKFKGLFGDTLYHQIIEQVSDELLDETIEHLNPKQLNRMVAMLTSSIPLAIDNNGNPDFTAIDDQALERLVNSSKGERIKQTIAMNADARQLVDNPNTTIGELPPHLVQRLQQPEWSAPVLANAVQQATDDQPPQGAIDTEAVNRMLSHYEQLLDKPQQQQVAARAGQQLASMEAVALGNVLAQKFKGLFGDTLYHQIIEQVSDELLDETIEHLNPKQLNRMVAMLTSSIPLAIDNNGNPDFTAIDDQALERLVNSSKGERIKQTIAMNVDARQLVDNPNTTIGELPPHLVQRLQQPEWSAPVLANAVQQATDDQPPQGAIDTEAVNRMLSHYEQLLDKPQQQQVAARAGQQLASMEAVALGNVLAQKFKGLFGDTLYHQIIEQVSDELLDETIEHLNPKQLNRMVAMLTSSIPLAIDNNGNPDFTAIDDQALERLVNSSKGERIKQTIAMNVDARQLVDNPNTTIGELPPHLVQRLQQPEWSAPVLANAVQQATDDQPPQGAIDTEAVNRMLSHYEQLLDKPQQQQVAARAGQQLASMEAVALGNVLAQKFKGLFGDTLYHQIIEQVSDELLDETIEHLNPKQLNRMVAMLTSSIPLAIDNNGNPDFTAIDDQALERLVNSSKGERIKQTIAMNADARQLVDNPNTTIGELPPHLVQRLQQPEWSAPVLANAVQQATDDQPPQGAIDTEAVNRMLSHYEQLLDKPQQQQVAARAGQQLASMEAVALGNVLAQKFKGLFGDTLYHQIIEQVSDELLDETIEHLNPKQLNRMVAMLTSSIPLATKTSDAPAQIPPDNSILQRLTHTAKGSIIEQTYAQQVDAEMLRRTTAGARPVPGQLKNRLQQPAWSGSMLVSAAQLAVDPPTADQGQTDFNGFDQLLDGYAGVLDNEQQAQIAIQAGKQLAGLDENELGVILVQRFKGLFGEKLYTEVVKHLTDDKLATLTQQMYRFVSGQALLPEGETDQAVTSAYKRLMQTVKNVKMQTVVDMYQERQEEEAKNKAEQIRKGIQSLLANDADALADRDTCEALPDKVIEFIEEGENGSADTLLMHIAVALQSEKKEIRLHAAKTLADTARILAEHGQWDRLVKLLPALEQSLQLLAEDENSIKHIITAISGLAHHHLEGDNYAKAFEIVRVINRITSSAAGITVNEAIREHGESALDKISSDAILQKLLTVYLGDASQRENAGNLLTDLGKRSAGYQLQYLMDSESRVERKLLFNLIKQTGNAARDILLEQLHQPSPWYVTRNIIRLLGEIGETELMHSIFPYIGYNDIRVQQEVLNTGVKIGGEAIPRFLLQALQTMDNQLKTKVVQHMGNFPDESYVRPLTDLLELNKPFQGKNKTFFQLTLCKTLGIIGSRRALPSLQKVAQSKSVLGIAGYADEVRNAAAQTARRIRARRPSASSHQLPDNTAMTTHHDDPSSTSVPASVSEQENAIFELFEQGKTEEAKEALFDLITATARAGDFQNAERLRERIYEIDPMALSEIIRSGEIIEQEKSGSINQDDLNIWSQLTDELTSEEFHTLYHELRERLFSPEETIVQQGAQNDELLFINQGSVKASHRIGDKEIFITTLGRGEIVGENTFNPSTWTLSLTALTQARIYVLRQEQLVKLKEQFPGVENKLHAFYTKTNKVPEILRKKGLERRMDQRFRISRKIQVQPTDNQGKPIGRGFRADIFDISRGGLAFLIRITKKENARLLLGRRLQVVLPVGGKINYLYLQGQSIGIQPHNTLESDYAVHFKFLERLDAEGLQNILG